MAGIFGLLGLSDNEHAFVSQLGQELVFSAANQYLEMITEDALLMTSVFIEGMTEAFKERYKLPGGGRLQRRSSVSQSAATKASGSWDVAYPVEEFGANITYTRRSVAKLTVAELNRHIQTVEIQYRNTLRFEILKRIFNNVETSFVDEDHGTLLVEPLANGDTVVYPPVLGSESEATENHYLESNYAASAISDTNNPFVTMVDELEEHFGAITGGSNIVTFINQAQTAKTMALSGFRDVPDNFISMGADADIPERLPTVPGKVIGRMVGQGATWVSEWRWIPSGWAVSIHLDEPAPLVQRAPLAAWGLPAGIQLVAESDTYPFHSAEYEMNFGVGCGNRLNGVVMEFGTGGTYTIPTAYA